jgi:hypothetical protein
MLDAVSPTTVAELKRVRAEGQAADVGAGNPYYGRMVLAAVWRGGYRRMLYERLAKSPARQSFLRSVGSGRTNAGARGGIG